MRDAGVDIEGHTVSHSSLNARKGKTDESQATHARLVVIWRRQSFAWPRLKGDAVIFCVRHGVTLLGSIAASLVQPHLGWNTLQIARILETLRQTGTSVAVEDLAHVSPLLHRNSEWNPPFSPLSRGSTCRRIRYRMFSQPGGLWAIKALER